MVQWGSSSTSRWKISKIEGILEKLKITPEPRDESIRLDKPVMLGGPLAEDRGFILHIRPPILLPAFAFQTTQ